MRGDRRAVCVSILALLLFVSIPAVSAMSLAATVHAAPALVPTQVCNCSPAANGSSTVPQYRGHGPPNEANYDEQIGITFAESYTSLEYNVTAVVQTDPQLDTGPAYLLNGLSNNGFWYQVGVSWNWGPGQNPGTGFDMNYEVFNSVGNSIYPANGGGLSAFSGTVNAGDIVTLNLYFNNSSQVVMIAEDLNTGAYAQVVYSSEGGSYFTGLPNSVANSNGFFTGLMTEWYHGAPYYANLEGTVYTTNLAISSGWMWMDEFNPNNEQAVFAANATSASSFTANPTALQEFAYNGTTEYASGIEFVSGALPSGTSTTTTTTTSTSTNSTSGTTLVPLTLSYSVVGTGTGYSAPELTYTVQGSTKQVPLSLTPTTYSADPGSQWSVSGVLPGSTSSERWATSQDTSGTASGAQTIVFQYQLEFNATVESNAPNGGYVTPNSSDWYDQGTQITITATPYANWAFEGWTINGLSLAASSGSTIVVMVEQSINATATFYPGLMITTPAQVSVTYSYAASQNSTSGATQGVVAPGSSTEIYVPPATMITVKASPTSFLYLFKGWLDVQTSAGTIVFSISSPSSLTAESGVNYLNIALVAVLVAFVVALSLVAVRRGRGSASQETIEPEGGIPPEAPQPQPGPQPTEGGTPDTRDDAGPAPSAS